MLSGLKSKKKKKTRSSASATVDQNRLLTVKLEHDESAERQHVEMDE